MSVREYGKECERSQSVCERDCEKKSVRECESVCVIERVCERCVRENR